MKLIFIFLTLFSLTFAKITVIDFNSAKRIYSAKSGLFIDARESKKYKKGTIAGAINIPLKKYKRLKRFLPHSKVAKIVLFCGGLECQLSSKLAKKIESDFNYTNILIYKGGYPQWSSNRQDVMVLSTFCNKKSITKAVDIEGIKVQLGKESGTIDTKWFKENYKRNKLAKNITLIDVRNKNSYKKGHLKGAINIPYNYDKNYINFNKFPKKDLIILYCNSGVLSSNAYESLEKSLKKRVLYIYTNIRCNKDSCKISSSNY